MQDLGLYTNNKELMTKMRGKASLETWYGKKAMEKLMKSVGRPRAPRGVP